MKIKNIISIVATLMLGTHIVGAQPVKRVLVEKFTTEKCGFCPQGTAHLESAVAMLPQADQERVIQVYHHAGYGTDWLTTNADTDIVAFLYNDHGSVYAPAFMVDRSDFGVASQVYHRPTPVFGDTGASVINKYISSQLNTTAPVSVEIEGSHDRKERILNLKVTGTRYEDFEDYPARVTIYVLEDGIKARSQASGGSGYIHDHTIRANNASWGEEVVWDGDNYTYSCTLKYPVGCDVSRMEVVAALNQYTKSDPMQCLVFNTNSVHLSQLAASTVDEMEVAPIVKVEDGRIVVADGTVRVFGFDGKELKNEGLRPGIYVAQISVAGRQYSVKTVVR